MTGPLAHNVGIGSWPDRRARITPSRTALVYGERSWTYAELAQRTRALSAGLRRLGVRRGDRIAYLGANHPAFLETLFAAGSLGALLVPLNTRLAAAEVAFMLSDSGACVLVHGDETTGTAQAAIRDTRTVRHVISVAPAGRIPAAVPYADVVSDGADSGSAGSEGNAAVEDVTLDDRCMIIYTSGTTGRPKGAVITHGNVTFNMINQLAHVDVLHTDVALGVAPMFHTAGLNQVTMPTLFKGGTVVVEPRFDPVALLSSVRRLGVTAFSAVPTMLQMIVDSPAWDTADVSSLRHVIYGGSPVLERVARAWLDRGVPLLQGYGMTEASPGVVLAAVDGAARRPVSAGVPHFFTDVAVDVGGVATAPLGRTGELLVRGPNVFAEYWGRPEATSDSFAPGGWFRSGDAVRVEDDGWTHVIDRLKDLFISGGENVYPAEVEAALNTHPDVAACAVVGVPDDRWGEVGCAFVVRRGRSGLTEAGIAEHLRGRLAGYKVPKHVRFTDAIPTNATGKIRRAELRDLARREIGGGGRAVPGPASTA